jgi:acyl transferase domain-containing protein
MPFSPIAVLGAGCRLPRADGVEQYWEVLRNEVDATADVPKDRWERHEQSSAGAQGNIGTLGYRRGGFIEQADWFDADLFGISTREAERMDPQQGIVLESAWQALEYAGIAPDSLRGARGGVFIGVSNSDFDRALCSNWNNLDLYGGTGTSYSIVANRVSYVLGLSGPSMVVDLACSSSLCAVHLACRSLQLRECDIALAGGVHLILAPEKSITLARAGVLARSGRCKSFSAHADGFVRGEGCGVIVLKRLEDALADEDPIFAVILGSAVNHNGMSNGLSAPSGVSLRQVIEDALAAAGVSCDSIGYVEAHGGSTVLGDLIEVNALRATLSKGRSPQQLCLIGSVKPNIGHLEGAGGIASLIKAMLVLREGWIPKSLHAEPPNPQLRLENSALQIATRSQAWSNKGVRRVGVTTTSFGGANAHVVVEEHPRPSSCTEPVPRMVLLPVSARTLSGLTDLAERYRRYCSAIEHAATKPDFAEVCYTAGVGRAHLPYRLAIVASGFAEAADKLGSFIGAAGNGSTSGPARQRRNVVVVFLLSPQEDRALSRAAARLAELGVQPDILCPRNETATRLARDLQATADDRLLNGGPVAIEQDELVSRFEPRPAKTSAVRQTPATVLLFTFGDQPAPLLKGGVVIRVPNADVHSRELMEALAEAYRHGIVPDWRAACGTRRRIAGLPTYAFGRQRYWRSSTASRDSDSVDMPMRVGE